MNQNDTWINGSDAYVVFDRNERLVSLISVGRPMTLPLKKPTDYRWILTTL